MNIRRFELPNLITDINLLLTSIDDSGEITKIITCPKYLKYITYTKAIHSVTTLKKYFFI